MKYELKKIADCKRRWRDQRRHVWPYISAKDAEKNELDIEDIFADVGSDKENNGDSLHFLGRKLWLKDRKEKLSRRKRIVGYIPCTDEDGNEGYIRLTKKSRKIVAILVLFLLLAGMIGGWFVWKQRSKIDLDEAAISYQMPNGMKNENPNEIMTPVFTELLLPVGSNKVTAGLVNPEGNPCYFQYSIYLKEDEKGLYESKWIEPGTAVVEFEIEEKLDVGEYPISIRIKTGSLKDPEAPMNGVEIDAVLKVE